MEYMSTCSDKEFDLAIVDPPYGMVGNTFNGKSLQFCADGTKSFAIDKKKITKVDLGQRPGKDYFNELFRISKNQIIFGMQYFVEYLHPHQCVLVWDKRNGTNRFSDAEIAWTSFDGGTRIINRWMKPLGRIHPTQKPIELYAWILSEFCNPQSRVIDTHLGSGSSAIAAHKFGCDFVGCEIDKKYFGQTMKRFNLETAQTILQF